MPDNRLCVDNAVYKVAKQMLAGIIERFIDDHETQIRFEKLLRPYARYLEIGLPYQHKVLLAIDQATQDDLIKFGFWPAVSTFRSQLLSGQISPRPEPTCPKCRSPRIDLEADGTVVACRQCGWKIYGSPGKSFDESDIEARFE